MINIDPIASAGARPVTLTTNAEVVTLNNGFTVTPGTVRPTRFRTYDDHRMAMSLALLGLRASGVEIEDPGCVAKTYPDFFADLATLH